MVNLIIESVSRPEELNKMNKKELLQFEKELKLGVKESRERLDEMFAPWLEKLEDIRNSERDTKDFQKREAVEILEELGCIFNIELIIKNYGLGNKMEHGTRREKCIDAINAEDKIYKRLYSIEPELGERYVSKLNVSELQVNNYTMTLQCTEEEFNDIKNYLKGRKINYDDTP